MRRSRGAWRAARVREVWPTRGGWRAELAGNAAEAGATAILQGTDPKAAARDALPGWSDDHVEIEVKDRRVRVVLRPVPVIPGVADRLTARVVADAGPEA